MFTLVLFIMRAALALVSLIGFVHPRPQMQTIPFENAKPFIESFSTQNDGMGEYEYNFKTSDGQYRAEKRFLKNRGTKDERAVVEGVYSYNGTDDKQYAVGYRSDDEGFKPERNRIPNATNVRRAPTVGLPFHVIPILRAGGLR